MKKQLRDLGWPRKRRSLKTDYWTELLLNVRLEGCVRKRNKTLNAFAFSLLSFFFFSVCKYVYKIVCFFYKEEFYDYFHQRRMYSSLELFYLFENLRSWCFLYRFIPQWSLASSSTCRWNYGKPFERSFISLTSIFLYAFCCCCHYYSKTIRYATGAQNFDWKLVCANSQKQLFLIGPCTHTLFVNTYLFL